jgi:hypothetical protein
LGPALEEALRDANARINAELNRRPNARMSMPKEAQDKLTLVQTEVIADIGIDAIRIARRRGLRNVDEKHVDEAASLLGVGDHDRIWTTVMNNVGGVLLGAGLAAMYAIMFGSGIHATNEILTAWGLSVAGTVLMAVGFTMSAMRRR